jgi:hypothetical protein
LENLFSSCSSENGTAEKNPRAQGGWLLVSLHSACSLKLTEQIEEKQDGSKSGFSRKELLEAKVIRSQIVFRLASSLALG